MNTSPGFTQSPVAPCAGASSKQQTKQKYKPNNQQTGLPPHPSEEKQANKQKLSTNLTLYEAHTNHWTSNLRSAETKRKKEFNLEAWKKETLNTICQKKKKEKRKEKAEKYYTNE